MKGRLLLLGALLCTALLSLSFMSDKFVNDPRTQDMAPLYVGGTLIAVEIADTVPKQVRGLSGRERLQENEGLLFAFSHDAKHGIWMKEMNFSIDIVWAKEDGKIIHVEREVSPSTYPQIFEPDEDSRYVLELPAGFLDLNGIEEGDMLSRPLDR